MSNQSSSLPHSAEYFGSQRDYWWNDDFLALMAKRWSLHSVGTLLDVGCGRGHWTKILLPHLAATTKIYGVDAEARWIDDCVAWKNQAEHSERLSFQVARAESLPFDADTFDLVTCQTLLIHVSNVTAVVREMLRVLRPGGRLCLIEPNNLARCFTGRDVQNGSIASLLDLARLQLTCERGKKALGLGDDSSGEYVPEVLHALGVADIDVRLSDKAFSLIPPYRTLGEAAELVDFADWIRRDFWIWDKSDTCRYFQAGGGAKEDFKFLWNLAMCGQRRRMERLQEGREFRAGGNLIYLISGIKA